MSDNEQAGEKTEEGSEKKIRDAIEGGNIPFSREASVFLSLGAILLVSSLMLAGSVRRLAEALAQLFANPAKSPFATTADTMRIFSFAGEAATSFLIPIVLVLMMAGLVAGFAQGLPRLVLERITPKWSKVSPMAGLKRLGGRDGQIEFLKNVSKLTIVVVIVTIVMRSEAAGLVQMLYVDPASLCGLTLAIVERLVAGCLVAYALLSAGDLVWAHLRWRRELRMTKQEVKDEFKQAEGDPIFKAKRRSLAMDRARRRMMAQVPKATLIIANPTHFAIALRYVREEGGAPMVVAKGQDLIALKIRELAEGLGIPVIEDKALARSMYRQVEVSQMIPAEFYKAVAELIHFIHARGGKPAPALMKA